MKKLQDFFDNVNIHFVQSAANITQCPESEKAEFALLGRSNVGKSSFVNLIFSSRSLAKVSKEPGKTRLLNFFSFNDDISFVDLPGYGYARISHDKRAGLSTMIREYCENRTQLAGIIWLLDYRRDKGTDIDKEAAEWLSSLDIPVFVVLTKRDKLNARERIKNRASIAAIYGLEEGIPFVASSTYEKDTCEHFWDAFYKWITPDTEG